MVACTVNGILPLPVIIRQYSKKVVKPNAEMPALRAEKLIHAMGLRGFKQRKLLKVSLLWIGFQFRYSLIEE